MKTARYKLDKYTGKQNRFTCPSCLKGKVFTRFIDNATREYLPEKYGRCDREDKCGYFLSPYKDGYANQSWANQKEIYEPPKEQKNYHGKYLAKRKIPTDIPNDLFLTSLMNFDNNIFVSKYLIPLLGKEIALGVVKEYCIGTSDDRWPGATIFWFIDSKQKIKAGQVKQFDHSGHTAKYIGSTGESKSCTDWIHSILKRQKDRKNQPLPEWLTNYLENEIKIPSLYGEHLLSKYPNKTVALCEAPATAIVCSVYFPQFVWLATGSLSYFTKERCKSLYGKNVILFPDTSESGNAFRKWKEKASELSNIANFNTFALLEKKSSSSDKLKGLDIRDYVTKYNHTDFSNPILSPIIKIDTKDIQRIFETPTSAEFDNLTIVLLETIKNKYYYTLFDREENLVSPHSNVALVERLSQHFNMTFEPFSLDGEPGLIYEAG